MIFPFYCKITIRQMILQCNRNNTNSLSSCLIRILGFKMLIFGLCFILYSLRHIYSLEITQHHVEWHKILIIYPHVLLLKCNLIYLRIIAPSQFCCHRQNFLSASARVPGSKKHAIPLDRTLVFTEFLKHRCCMITAQTLWVTSISTSSTFTISSK